MSLLAAAAIGCSVAASAGAAPGSLPPSLRAALARADIDSDSVAVVARKLDAGQAEISHRSTAVMNPASLIKLLTTLAGLEVLGVDFRFSSEAFAAVAPQGDVIDGDLVLRGSGDPLFTTERLWQLLRELRQRGLRQINGDLIIDNSFFAPIDHDAAAFDDKPQRPYNVGPDAMLFNFAAMTLTLIPDAQDAAVQVLVDPQPAHLQVDNRLRSSAARYCGAWRQALRANLEGDRLTLSGAFPRACGERQWHLAGIDNGVLLHGVFTRLWRELGGRFSGRLKYGATPPTAVLLASSESPPLGELVRSINKHSNNVMARQLYLRLGGGEAATAEHVVRAWLALHQLDFAELVLDNGAGLSRDTRISAGSLAQLLQLGWTSASMPEFIASLSIAAVDGTAKKKFDGVNAAGRAHLKTGSLDGVRGVAGYLLDKNGHRHLLVFMVNHANASAAQPAFDALLEWLWSGGG